MCLSIPGKVVSIKNNIAKVTIGGTVYEAGTQLIEDIKIGDFVLLHTGYIIQILSEDEAEENIKYLRELGDIDEEVRNYK
jgi:hydrogenase expression/formation protein HypC